MYNRTCVVFVGSNNWSSTFIFFFFIIPNKNLTYMAGRECTRQTSQFMIFFEPDELSCLVEAGLSLKAENYIELSFPRIANLQSNKS